ncbi:hypothetical protein [Streptomyces sp. NPDC026659]|uniref:hypothetical protein n=1 Tax=Streptomyces sp. NPDC026659 TaxID=3155123 RepID=UPI0033FDF0D8
MARERYDQRVRVFVEVRGGQDDWQEAEERFARHGWPVRGHHPAGQGPLGDAVTAAANSRVYEIEVRLFGIARGCDQGAADRVRKVARAARLEMYVLHAGHVHRDRETRSRWRVVDASGRRSARRSPWRRHFAGWSLARGAHDIGGIVTGTARQALRLARNGSLDGQRDGSRPGSTATGRVAVRPLDGMWKDPAGRWPEEKGERRAVRAAVWAFVPAVALAFATHAIRASWWFWGVLAFVGVVGAARAGLRLFPDRRKSSAVVVLGTSVLFMVAALGPDGDAWTPSGMLYTFLVLGVVAGLWLLVRQWSWGEWVGWAVPLVITLVISTFVAAGSVLHALYADELGLSTGDLDVPPLWQFLASLKLVSMLAYVLVVPAWWGVARHRHHSYAAPGDRTNVLLHTFVFVASLTVAAGFALDSASAAAHRTKAAAEHGTEPPPYFGVEPAWTCVRTTSALENVPGEGPELAPDRPYLLINVAGGTAVLWDQVTGEPVKIPANKAWLAPAEGGKGSCG